MGSGDGPCSDPQNYIENKDLFMCVSPPELTVHIQSAHSFSYTLLTSKSGQAMLSDGPSPELELGATILPHEAAA